MIKLSQFSFIWQFRYKLFVFSFQRNYFLNMQKLLNQSTRQMLKCPSLPIYQESLKYRTATTIYTSSSSIESVDDQWRRSAIKWLISFDKKVTKDTNYLSVWYLQLVQRNGLLLKEYNWQQVSAAVMMLASKMNQIYPPHVNSILKRCKSTTQEITRDSLIEMEAKILNLMEFDMAVQSPYNLIYQMIKDSKKDIDECEKLLKIIIYNKEINQNPSDTIACAIMYLVARSKVDAILQGETRSKVKIVAQKIYNFYKEAKSNHDAQKNKIQEQKVLPKMVDANQSKENKTGNIELQNSIGSYSKPNQSKQNKTQQNYFTLPKAKSFKFMPKQHPFTQKTNHVVQEKIVHHCLSKEELKASKKNFYLPA